MKKNSLSVLFGLLLSLLSACSFLGVAPETEIALTNLTLSDVNVFSTKLQTTFRVANDTKQQVTLSGAVLRLYINGDYVGKGSTALDATLEPYSAKEFSLDIAVSNLSLANKVQTWLSQTGFEYRVEGHLDTSGSSFFGTGRLNVAASDSFKPLN